MSELCPHDDDPHSCPPCQRAKRPAEPKPSGSSHPFRARFDGHCTGCNLPVHVGQMIQMTDGCTHHEECSP